MASAAYNIDPTVDLRLNPLIYRLSCRLTPFQHPPFQHRFPEKHFILSGGLNHENVHTAVEQTRPAAVDVASGVESSPGVKDLEKVRWFIEQARAAAGRTE